MALIVQKYGGSSVPDIENIRRVARKIVEARKEGNELVVVVSAMAGETDKLGKFASSLSDSPSLREYDNLVASGEQVSSSLLTIAIQSFGMKAISLLGYQIPIRTDCFHSKAVIDKVSADKIKAYIEDDFIVVVAGFQGVDEQGNITTFGRGGSDITAVALAATLKADICELYKDVPGVFTAEPSIVSCARLIKNISHETMLELSSMGAKIMNPRAVQIARKYNVPVSIKATFGNGDGTMIVHRKPELESTKVVAITMDRNEAKISIGNIPNEPMLAHKIFHRITEKKIWVDMIVQGFSRKGITDIAFTVARNHAEEVANIAKKVTSEIEGVEVYSNPKIAKISVIGNAMKIDPETPARIYRAMAKEKINILSITTSQMKISFVIGEKYAELAVRALHEEFELDKDCDF